MKWPPTTPEEWAKFCQSQAANCAKHAARIRRQGTFLLCFGWFVGLLNLVSAGIVIHESPWRGLFSAAVGTAIITSLPNLARRRKRAVRELMLFRADYLEAKKKFDHAK